MAPQMPSPSNPANQPQRFDATILADLRSYFAGRWTVEREVVDVTTMRGSCTFTPKGADLLQTEEFTYTLPTSGPLEGFSWYLWEFLEAGVVQLHRATSAGEPHTPFLQLAFREGAAAAEAHGVHVCDPDTYRATFRILSHAAFQITYHVTGPRKCYTSIASYRRS